MILFGIIIPMISLDDFKKIELRVAKILSAEPILESEKLIKLKVFLGDEERQIIAGIGRSYTPDDLIGREIVIIANLEPRKLMGEESQGMLLAATNTDGLPIIIMPEKLVPPGTLLR